ncbi:hypothetical protein VTN96DRAFT_7491 [Rasamsonia emersonii]
MRPPPPGSKKCHEFLDELQKELRLIKTFFDDDRSYLIMELAGKGDPRVAALSPPRTASYEQLFLFTLSVRYHARTYRAAFLDMDGDRLHDSGSRAHGHSGEYIEKYGLSPSADRVGYALRIGRKQQAVEEGVSLSGMSLVMTPMSRKLHALTSLEIDKAICLLAVFNEYEQIMGLSCYLSPDMDSYQEIFDSEVANWLAQTRYD